MGKAIATSLSEHGGEKEWEKKHQTLPVFPIFIWAHLLTDALNGSSKFRELEFSLSSGETGRFLQHPVGPTAAQRIRFLEKIKLQPTRNSPSPARNRPCQQWVSQHLCSQQAYLVLVAFLREVCNLTGFHPVSQPCNRGKDLLRACRKDQIPALGLGPCPPLMGRWFQKMDALLLVRYFPFNHMPLCLDI